MIPKTYKCRKCGRDVLYVPGGERGICVDAGLVGYEKRKNRDKLYTIEGGVIDGRVIRTDEDTTPDGYAHRLHWCR